jgi:protein TonB
MKKIITFLFLSFLFQGFAFCQTEETKKDSLTLEINENIKQIQEALPEEEKIFKVVEDMPRFPGCENQGKSKEELRECSDAEFLKYIYNNLKYPKKARKEKTEGRVIAQFTVFKDGSVGNVKMLPDIGNGCGEEVERLILSMNNMGQKWIPPSSTRKPVNVVFTLPVSFKLQSSPQKK